MKKPKKNPKNPKTQLTVNRVRKLLHHVGKYRDAEVRGLVLCVTSERSASWQLRFELHGRE